MKVFLLIVFICVLLRKEAESAVCYVCGTQACPVPFDISAFNVFQYSCLDKTHCTTVSRKNTTGHTEIYRFCSNGEYPNGITYISNVTIYFGFFQKTFSFNANVNVLNCNTTLCNTVDIPAPNFSSNLQPISGFNMVLPLFALSFAWLYDKV